MLYTVAAQAFRASMSASVHYGRRLAARSLLCLRNHQNETPRPPGNA